MELMKQSWRRLSRHKGDYDSGEFRFSSGSEWSDLPGLIRITPGRRGRRVKAQLYADQNDDGQFTHDELIFNSRSGKEEREVITALMNASGRIDLRREQSEVGMCTLPTVGAMCTYEVRSKLQLVTDVGDVVKLQPIGQFRRETMTVPVGPQSFEELGDLDYQPLPMTDLA